MIQRHFADNPVEAVEDFDWFNDYEDTRTYLRNIGDQRAIEILDAGQAGYRVGYSQGTQSASRRVHE